MEFHKIQVRIGIIERKYIITYGEIVEELLLLIFYLFTAN